MQTGEIIIIAILALVVLGPRRLPEMARKIGGWMSELRTAAREITAGLEAEVSDFKEVGRELKAPLDEVKKPLKEVRDDVRDAGRDVTDAGRDVKDAGREAYEWKGPKPVSGPTPEDAMRDYEEMNRLPDEEADGSPEASEDSPKSEEPTE